jgi:hypothetical protein
MSNEERESLKILLTLHGEMTKKIKAAPTSPDQFEGIFQHEPLTREGSSVSSTGATWATAGHAEKLSASPTGTEEVGGKGKGKEMENEAEDDAEEVNEAVDLKGKGKEVVAKEGMESSQKEKETKEMNKAVDLKGKGKEVVAKENMESPQKGKERKKENEAMAADGAPPLPTRFGNAAIGDQGSQAHSRNDSG